MKLLTLLLSFVFLVSCNASFLPPDASIDVKVSIGPLCGNIPSSEVLTNNNGNQCGLSNEALDKIYGNYNVNIKDSKGNIITKKLDHTGLASFDVAADTYTVYAESSIQDAFKFTKASELTKTIVLSKLQKQIININIQTGLQ